MVVPWTSIINDLSWSLGGVVFSLFVFAMLVPFAIVDWNNRYKGLFFAALAVFIITVFISVLYILLRYFVFGTA